MEPWEALDLDDSDLPSLLRPSKRNHPQPPSSTTTTTTNFSQPFLKNCSQSKQYSQAPPLPTICPHHIPGPARAVQTAMHRKSQSDRTFLCRGEDPIPTQEYIRRVVEDGGVEEDNDFMRNPWLCAVDFVRREGMVGGDGVAIGTPLGSIKNGIKVAQVVAIIKSSTPNGLGDLMVTLKDPTGTIGASIHRRVLSEGEFGKDISVGAALILQKVAVFSPSRSVHYLNITLSNVVKVISKDSEPPSKQNYPPSTVKHVAPGTEGSEKSQMPQKAFSLLQGRTEGIVTNLRQGVNVRGSVHNDEHMENDNAASQSGYYGNGSSRSQNAVLEKEPLLVSQNVASVIRKVSTRIDTNDNDKGVLVGKQHDSWNEAEMSNLSGSTQRIGTAATSVEVSNNQEIGNMNGTEKQRQPLVSRTSLPQWTDEQLDELFAFDCD